MREDLIQRARSEVDLRKMMHGDDRSNWSRSDRMMEELLTALEAARENAERLAEALLEAEKSLRAIADCAGLTKRLENASDVRGYANSRANAARAALHPTAAQESGRE